MSNNGYICLPRSLLENALWKDLPPQYKEVFTTVLELVCWKPKKFDDHGIIIDLEIGQICISERELLERCGKYISRNDIQRSFVKLKLYGFLSQKVSHRKSILTITHKDTYDLIGKQSEPKSEPNLSQSRAINKETKKHVSSCLKETSKEKAGELVPLSPSVSLFSSFSEEDLEAILAYFESKNIVIEEKTIKRWLKKYGKDKLIQTIQIMLKSTKPIPNPGGWIQKGLANDYAGKEKNTQINREFVNRFINETGIKCLRINLTCCTDINDNSDYQFNLPPETFRTALISKYK